MLQSLVVSGRSSHAGRLRLMMLSCHFWDTSGYGTQMASLMPRLAALPGSGRPPKCRARCDRLLWATNDGRGPFGLAARDGDALVVGH